MKQKFLLKKIFYIAILTAILLLPHFFIAKAQQGVFFLKNWQSDNYAPSWYQGKVFPSYGSRITVSFELVDNGKIVDISRIKVRWYVNDKLVKNETNGLGIKNYTIFNNLAHGGNEINVRISIVDYKGQNFDEIIIIPVKNPEVAIEAPVVAQQVSKDAGQFKAWPFFFNINNIADLVFKWLINGKDVDFKMVSGNILNLKIGDDISIGDRISLEVRVANPQKELELSSKSLILEVK